jgi:hypothetical protein
VTPQKFKKGENDLLTMFPSVAAEADGWDPSEFFARSGKKKLWRCQFNHQWEAIIANRTCHGQKCPYCTGLRAISGVNDLMTKFPRIAAEADGWDPSVVKYGAIKVRQWKCPNGHVYAMSPNSRTQGRSCPLCATSGFKTDRAAWIYFIKRGDERKIGITNVPRGRLGTHRRNGWTLIHKNGALDGYIAWLIESQIKRWLRDQGMILPGTQENWMASCFDARNIYEIAAAAGVDRSLWDQLSWGSSYELPITLFGETPVANRPPITAAIDLTPAILAAMKKAGPNERGNYSLDVAVWVNDRRSSDRAPSHTGTVKIKGDKESPKAYASVWLNEAEGVSGDLF